MVPATTRIAVLINPADAANSETMLKDVEAATRSMGLQIQVLNANTSHEIDAAFATFVRERPDALLVSGGPFLLSRRVQLALRPRATRSPPHMERVSMSKSAG